MKSGAWNQDQLAAIESALARINTAAQFHNASRGERNMTIHAVDMYWPGGASSLFPNSWKMDSKALAAEAHLDLFMPIADPRNKRFDPRLAKQAQDEILRQKEQSWFLKDGMVLMLITGFSSSAHRYADAQAAIDQARIACALEQSRLLDPENKYPLNLEPLTRLFSDGVPSDSCSGKPYHYGLNRDGSYHLYGEGWNLKDDGGTLEKWEDKIPGEYEGDWVWSFPDGKKPATDADK